MAIARPDYSCRHCGHCPTEREIAEAHFTKQCPQCHEPVELDAPGALTRSRGAALAGIAGMVVGLVVCTVIVNALGVTGERLQSWPQALRLALPIAIVLGGAAVGFSCQRAWVKRMLARVRRQMDTDAQR